MKKTLPFITCLTALLLIGCDTSINKQVEKKLEKTQHDALSPTGKLINYDENKSVKSGNPEHGVNLPDISQDIDANNIDQSTLIPVDQFNTPQQSKLKQDALKWQEANLQKSDAEDGAVLTIE